VAWVTGSVIAGWLAGGLLRRVSVRAGVCDTEAFGPLPGDEFIAHPMVEWTRGVGVDAAPERVWPWLAQMGYGRGGWYTPQWVDLFANRWVFGLRRPFPASASRLLPEYQHVAVGDLICDGPDYASYFRVLRVDPGHAVVYRSIRHPRRGSPIDITDPASPQRAEQQLRQAGTYIDFTWALILNEVPGQRTRLLVRTRANYSPRALKFLTLPLGLFDATYGVAQLRAIARRAEGTELAGTQPVTLPERCLALLPTAPGVSAGKSQVRIRQYPFCAPPMSNYSGRVHKLVGEHDHARAGAKDGHPRGDPLAQRADQVEGLGQLPDCGGLAAGDDQPGDLVHVGRPAHRQRAGACLLQCAQVLGHIPLER